MDSTQLRSASETPRDRSRRVRRQKKKSRRLAWKIAAGVLASILLGVGAGFFWLQSIQGQMQLEPEMQAKVKKVTAAPKGNVVNFLLVGTDNRASGNSARADTIVFVRADQDAGKAYMISIPRDSRVNIPGRRGPQGDGMDKINHSWAYGQAPLLIEAVSEFLDQPINYVFQVDFNRFEDAVNALGGVDFATQGSWTDGELGVTVQAGMRKRTGKEALAIIRNRSWGGATGGDFARVGVQRDFIKAMIAQSITSYSDVPRVANVVASYVNTNMGVSSMLGFGRSLSGGNLQIEAATLKGTGRMIGGVSYVIPDEEYKNELLRAMLADEPFPPE